MVQKNGSLVKYCETPRRENRPGMIKGKKWEEETEWRNFCHQPIQKWKTVEGILCITVRSNRFFEATKIER